MKLKTTATKDADDPAPGHYKVKSDFENTYWNQSKGFSFKESVKTWEKASTQHLASGRILDPGFYNIKSFVDNLKQNVAKGSFTRH